MPLPGVTETHEGDVVGKKRSADEAELEGGGAQKKVAYTVVESGANGTPTIELD